MQDLNLGVGVTPLDHRLDVGLAMGLRGGEYYEGKRLEIYSQLFFIV
jgi:hypothetical protein